MFRKTPIWLFAGTDIQVLNRGTLYRVRGVDGGSFIIRVKNRDVRIPMGTNPEKLRVVQVQTLTERSAIVTNFKHGRVYTATNDPCRKWSQGRLSTQAMPESIVAAENPLRDTPQTVEKRDSRGNVVGDAANPDYADAQANLRTVGQSGGGNRGSTEYYAGEMAAELERELFDALDVQFEVSSAKPIHFPYVIIVAKYHEKEDPKYTRNWLFAKAIAPIDSKPHQVSVREGGFPPGFVVDKLQVHLYENGLEIATDLSENRASLTREEAHEYLLIDHGSTPKTETMPARVLDPVRG